MPTKRLKIPMENTHHSLISEGVPECEQTLHTEKPFWVFLGGNSGIATWLIGVLIAGMGLDVTNALVVIFIGSLVGSFLPALTATMGPKSGLSQIEASRFSLGRSGKKLPAVLNWFNAIGWDVINNIISASAFVVLLAEYSVNVPMWLSLGILVLIQLIIGIYGHHLIQNTAKYTSSLLVFFFLIIGIVAMQKVGLQTLQQLPPDITHTLSALILLVAYNLGWATCTADYTRYLPKSTPSKTVFLTVFTPLFLSLLVFAFFGYMTASAVKEQTPEGVMIALQTLSGQFAPIVLLLVWFTAIPANALNDNSAAYTLISCGFKFSRPTSAVFGAVIGYVISLLATHSFVIFFEDFLFLFAHWVAPWAGVVLVHWFMVGQYNRLTPEGITDGCIIMLSVSIVSLALFSVNPLYTGPGAELLGDLDIGPYLGFFMSAGLYYALLNKRDKYSTLD